LLITAVDLASQDPKDARFSNAVERYTPTAPAQDAGSLSRHCGSTIYGNKLRIVSNIVVVTSVVDVNVVDVSSCGGGGGGDAAPGE